MIFESETKLRGERSRRDNSFFLVEISSGIKEVEKIRKVNRKVRKIVNFCQRRRLEMMEEKRTKIRLRVYADWGEGGMSTFTLLRLHVCECMWQLIHRARVEAMAAG